MIKPVEEIKSKENVKLDPRQEIKPISNKIGNDKKESSKKSEISDDDEDDHEEENQKARDRYRSSIDYQIIRRLQAQIRNQLPNTDYELEELIHCSKSFFVNWIKYLLGNKKLEEYDLDHVRAVNTFKNKEDSFKWDNFNLLLASENRSVKDIRDKQSERKHILKSRRYLEDKFVKIY